MVEAHVATSVGTAVKTAVERFSETTLLGDLVFDTRCSSRDLGEKLIDELAAAGFVIAKAPAP